MSMFDVFDGVETHIPLSHEGCKHQTPQEIIDCEDSKIATVMLILTRIKLTKPDQIMPRYQMLSEADRLRIEKVPVKVKLKVCDDADGKPGGEVREVTLERKWLDS